MGDRVSFGDLFHAIPTSAFRVNRDMKDALAHASPDGIMVGHPSFTVTIKHPDYLYAPEFLMHEIVHGSAQPGGKNYTHYEMVKAAWDVGGSMGLIYKMENFGLKDVTPNPNEDLAETPEEKKKINNFNSALFNAILIRACRHSK